MSRQSRTRVSVQVSASFLAMLLAVPSWVAPARAATIVAKVNLTHQRMDVSVDGKPRYSWRISSGREGYRTPSGTYQPFSMSPYYYSKKWHMALPYLVSIDDVGTAIHGTTQTGHLGSPASHGCIRLDTGNAATFYRLVQANGMDNTHVVILR